MIIIGAAIRQPVVYNINVCKERRYYADKNYDRNGSGREQRRMLRLFCNGLCL